MCFFLLKYRIRALGVGIKNAWLKYVTILFDVGKGTKQFLISYNKKLYHGKQKKN
jgi:hypothetical protein